VARHGLGHRSRRHPMHWRRKTLVSRSMPTTPLDRWSGVRGFWPMKASRSRMWWTR